MAMPDVTTFSAGRWITIVAYGLASVSCVLAARKRDTPAWLAPAATCLLLLLFRFLSLDNRLADQARGAFEQFGLGTYRRMIQAVCCFSVFGISIAVAAIAGSSASDKLGGRHRKSLFWSFVLAGGLVGFAIVRSISLHQMDRLLAMGIAGMQVNWLIEIPPVAAIAALAFRSSATEAPPSG